MPKAKYYYNPKTLRFERVKISFLNLLLASKAYAAFGVLFFCGLIILQNYVIQTPLERELRKENAALRDHKGMMVAQINEAHQMMDELNDRDLELFEKIFERTPTDNDLSENRKSILLTSEGDFRQEIEKVSDRQQAVFASAATHNNYFKDEVKMSKDEFADIQSTPVYTPIENFSASKLISGFGTRINPFHKGHYHHDGIDLAAPRGSAVLAGGPGRVIQMKQSDLLAGYGNFIEIDHGNGYVTRYAHLESFNVKFGQKVGKGEIIGTVGTTGGSVAPHVHYEVIKSGKNVDPVKYMIQGVDAQQYEQMLINSSKVNQSLD